MEKYRGYWHDDSRHTSPPDGSYLASHGNVADSSFLHGGSVEYPVRPPLTPTPPGDPTPATGVFTGTCDRRHTSLTFAMTAAEGPEEAVLIFGTQANPGKPPIVLTFAVQFADDAVMVATAAGRSPSGALP